MIRFNNAQFITSSTCYNPMTNELPEVAFVGRSNVGKSTLINALCSIKKLAKTSNTPGRTRLINYFQIDKKLYLVDLPGYGFAKGRKSDTEKWDAMLDDYFTKSSNLKIVIILVDIRRDISDLDVAMQQYLWDKNILYKIVLTKADKLSNNEKYVAMRRFSDCLRTNKENILITSADKNVGILELQKVIEASISY